MDDGRQHTTISDIALGVLVGLWLFAISAALVAGTIVAVFEHRR